MNKKGDVEEYISHVYWSDETGERTEEGYPSDGKVIFSGCHYKAVEMKDHKIAVVHLPDEGDLNGSFIILNENEKNELKSMISGIKKDTITIEIN